MKKKNCIIYVVIVLFILFLIGLGWCNCKNNPDFWDISIGTCLSLFVAIIFSFVFVQQQTNKRIQKDNLLRVLSSILEIVSDENAYIIAKDTVSKTLTMRNRKLNNRVDIIKKYCGHFGIKDDIAFIEDKISEYTDLIGNHISDIEYLSKSESELQRPLGLIEDRIYEIMLKLF